MEQAAAGNEPPRHLRPRERLALWLALAALSAVIFAQRLHTYREPLEADVSSYMVVAHECLRGARLYVDIWDHKPPLLFVTFGIAEALLGYGHAMVLGLTVATGLITLLAVARAGRHAGGVMGGIWAAAIWASVSGELFLGANEANIECFLNASLAWAFALLLDAPPAASSRRAIAVGALFTAASLYKHNILPYPVFLAAAHVAFAPGGRAGRRAAAKDAAIIAAVAVGTWIAVGAYFALTGRFGALWDGVVSHNTYYVGDPIKNLLSSFWPGQIIFVYYAFTRPLFLVAVAGAIFGRPLADRRSSALLVAYATATWITVALPGRFWYHYFQLWLPLLAVAVGWSVAALARRRAWIGHAAGAAALAVVLSHVVPDYRRPAVVWSHVQAGSDIYVLCTQQAHLLDEILRDEENFYVFGDEGIPLYVLTGRRPPTAFLFRAPLYNGSPEAPVRARIAIAQIEAHPPELVLVTHRQSVIDLLQRDHPFSNWIREHYVPEPAPRWGPFLFLARRDGRLDRLARSRTGR